MADVVPAMLEALVDSAHVRGGELRSLRDVYVGGSSCRPDLIAVTPVGKPDRRTLIADLQRLAANT